MRQRDFSFHFWEGVRGPLGGGFAPRVGALSHANGEVYEGEFRNGRADGLGHLESANGDTYDGHLERNRFHGLGRFRKSNGDAYLGYCVHGKAEGLGVLAFASGEKYKGCFKADALRQGRASTRTGAATWETGPVGDTRASACS